MKTVTMMLHPGREPGSDVKWNTPDEGVVSVMMVDGSTSSEFRMFEREIKNAINRDDSLTHLSVHKTKGPEQEWDWTGSPLWIKEIGPWVLLRDHAAVTLPQPD